MGGKVHHGAHIVFLQNLRNEFTIPRVADDQVSVEDRFLESGGEIVEYDDDLAGFAKLANHVATDVTGATGN